MPKLTEFTPFPIDEKLQTNNVFLNMVDEWRDHLDYDVYQTAENTQSDLMQTSEEVYGVVFGWAKRYFASQNPHQIVHKALWVANNDFLSRNKDNIDEIERIAYE